MYIFYNSYGVRPFVSCMQTWTDNNCMDEDRADVIMSFLSTVRDEYRSSNTAAKSQLLQSKLLLPRSRYIYHNNTTAFVVQGDNSRT